MLHGFSIKKYLNLLKQAYLYVYKWEDWKLQTFLGGPTKYKLSFKIH